MTPGVDLRLGCSSSPARECVVDAYPRCKAIGEHLQYCMDSACMFSFACSAPYLKFPETSRASGHWPSFILTHPSPNLGVICLVHFSQHKSTRSARPVHFKNFPRYRTRPTLPTRPGQCLLVLEHYAASQAAFQQLSVLLYERAVPPVRSRVLFASYTSLHAHDFISAD